MNFEVELFFACAGRTWHLSIISLSTALLHLKKVKMGLNLIIAVIASVSVTASAAIFDDSLGAHAGFPVKRALPGMSTFTCAFSVLLATRT